MDYRFVEYFRMIPQLLIYKLAATLTIACFVLSVETMAQTSPDGQTGKYTLTKKHSKTKQAYVTGKFVDIETGEPIIVGLLLLGDKRIMSDSKGFFSVPIEPGSYKFAGVSFPYFRVTTKPIKVKASDSLFISFKLLISKQGTVN